MQAKSWSQRLKIVAESSSHPSRCRWTAGERASSRDARDKLVSELNQSAYQCVGRRVSFVKIERSIWKSAGGGCRLFWTVDPSQNFETNESARLVCLAR